MCGRRAVPWAVHCCHCAISCHCAYCRTVAAAARTARTARAAAARRPAAGGGAGAEERSHRRGLRRLLGREHLGRGALLQRGAACERHLRVAPRVAAGPAARAAGARPAAQGTARGRRLLSFSLRLVIHKTARGSLPVSLRAYATCLCHARCFIIAQKRLSHIILRPPLFFWVGSG